MYPGKIHEDDGKVFKKMSKKNSGRLDMLGVTCMLYLKGKRMAISMFYQRNNQ